MAAKRVSRALSPYAKAQRKAMRAAGIKPDPKPKFKIGNRVRVTDTSVVGTVTFIGSYDAYIGQYRYKIKDDDARGGQKYWNEDSLVKTSRKVENPSRKAGRSPFDVNARLETDSGPPTRFSAKDMAAIRKAAVGVARRTTSMRSESRGSAVYAEPSVVRTSLGSVTVNAEYTSYGWRGVVYHKGVRDSFSIDADVALENPSRKPIDHKFAGALFSAGHSKTALAYLRGTLTKSTARELAAGKKRR